MDVQKLRYFRAVAQHRNFEKAAAALSVGLPGFTQEILALERDLGVQLLEKEGGTTALTSAGVHFQGHAEEILGALDAAVGELAALRNDPEGKVSIGLSPAIDKKVLVSFVQQFREQFANVSLEIMEGFSGSVVEWLSTGRVDIGVLYNAPKASYLLVDLIRSEELFLFGPADAAESFGARAVTIDRFSDLPLIVPSRRNMLADSDFSHMGRTFTVVLEVDSLDLILDLVEAGIGYSILPASAGADLLAQGRLCRHPIERSLLQRQLVLATSTQRPATELTRAAINMLRKALRNGH